MSEYSITFPMRLEGRLGGAAGGGVTTSRLAVGGLDEQTETGYSYNNYVIGYVTPVIPKNNVITKARLIISTTDNDLSAYRTWVSMLLINEDNNTEMFLYPNSVQYKSLNGSWVKTDIENVIVFSAVAQASRQTIAGVYLEISYTDTLIPVEPIIDTVSPIYPSIVNIQSDMNNNYCDNSFTITVDYARNTNYIFEIAYGTAAEIESNTIKTINTPLSQLVIDVPTVIPEGKNIFIRVRGVNSYGKSSWSLWNNLLIKNHKPVITNVSITSDVISKIATNFYMVYDKPVRITTSVYDKGGTRSSSNIVKLQHMINGAWVDIPNTSTNIGLSGNVSFYVDPMSDDVNGGILSSEKLKEYRVVYTDNKIYAYSSVITLIKNDAPTITSNETIPYIRTPYQGTINIYPIIKDIDSNLSSVFVTVMEKQSGTSYFVPATVLTFALYGGLYNNVLQIPTTLYKANSELMIALKAVDTLGTYSEVYTYPSIFIVNEPVPKPTLELDYYYNIYNRDDPMNFMFNETVKIKWSAITRTNPDSEIIYQVFVDNTTTVYKTLLSDKLEFEYDISNISSGQRIQFWVRATDGFNTSDMSNPITVFKNVRPSIDNSLMIIYSGPSYMNNSILQNITGDNDIPEILYVQIPNGQSTSTKQNEITYRLYVYNETQNTLVSQSITNVTRSSVKVSFYIWLSMLGISTGDRIKMFVNAVDRFGVESSTITLS